MHQTTTQVWFSLLLFFLVTLSFFVKIHECYFKIKAQITFHQWFFTTTSIWGLWLSFLTHMKHHGHVMVKKIQLKLRFHKVFCGWTLLLKSWRISTIDFIKFDIFKISDIQEEIYTLKQDYYSISFYYTKMKKL